MKLTRNALVQMLAFCVASCPALTALPAADAAWSLPAPDKTVSITVALRSPDTAASPRLYYTVEHHRGPDVTTVLPWSPLGIVRQDIALVDGLSLDEAEPARELRTQYTMPFGKRRACPVHANTRRLTFAGAAGQRLEVELWAAHEGVAFRYRFPEINDKPCVVVEERTGFQFPKGTHAWMSPYQMPSKYTPAYEEYYENDIPVGTPSPIAAGWVFPALFQTPSKHWVLLTEAGLDGTYCGSRLAANAPNGLYRLRFPEPGDGAGAGNVNPIATRPWTMPWRVVMVADGLNDLFESTMVNDLSAPSKIADTSWIKPGRVAWSWWSDHSSPTDYAKQCRFIDLAAEMGWEYYLVDANWTLMDGGTVRQLIDYAKSKGVGVLLWYNSGGEHNTVTEKPRGTMKLRGVRRFEFDLLRKWGVKGIKVDFFQSDKQNIIQQYLGILQDAADYHMLINFHGCTVPRGWSRTWPNLVSMEAIKGEECYSFDATYPQRAAEYNTIAPFTRNVVGPADLTPVAFTDHKYPHLTTNAHELALSVVFECGFVHFADSVESYRSLPAEPKDFLRHVPVSWDETRLLAGHPGRLVAVARRSGSTWYVGVIHSGSHAVRLPIACRFLGSGSYRAMLIGDGKDDRSFETSQSDVDANQSLTLHLRPRGGVVVRMTPISSGSK